MSLLDEAIREHLDLKRRRGADPSEVERLEREALGPVRRSPHDAPEALIDDPSRAASGYPAEEEAPYGLEEAPDRADASEDRARFDHGFEPSPGTPPAGHWGETESATEIAPLPERDYEAEVPERTSDLPRHHEIAEEWEAHERQGMLSEPAGFEPDEPGPAPPPFGSDRERPAAPEGYDLEQETMEHDVEGEELGQGDAPVPGEGEDMLEETPDFLQDTPDHDRLWFEQRPPRDFDFDG
jgi:hypothetical protein